MEVLEAVKKPSEDKNEKEIITDETNFTDKNNQYIGDETKNNTSVNNIKETK